MSSRLNTTFRGNDVLCAVGNPRERHVSKPRDRYGSVDGERAYPVGVFPIVRGTAHFPGAGAFHRRNESGISCANASAGCSVELAPFVLVAESSAPPFDLSASCCSDRGASASQPPPVSCSAISLNAFWICSCCKTSRKLARARETRSGSTSTPRRAAGSMCLAANIQPEQISTDHPMWPSFFSGSSCRTDRNGELSGVAADVESAAAREPRLVKD